MAEQVAKAYATKRPIPVQAVWNGSFLPAAARATTTLNEGDALEVVAPTQGG